MMLKNKTLVVCGAGPGLGSEVARGALRDGANLVLAARTEKKIRNARAEGSFCFWRYQARGVKSKQMYFLALRVPRM